MTIQWDSLPNYPPRCLERPSSPKSQKARFAGTSKHTFKLVCIHISSRFLKISLVYILLLIVDYIANLEIRAKSRLVGIGLTWLSQFLSAEFPIFLTGHDSGLLHSIPVFVNMPKSCSHRLGQTGWFYDKPCIFTHYLAAPGRISMGQISTSGQETWPLY